MKQLLLLALLATACASGPLEGQQSGTPPLPTNQGQVGAQDLPPNVCPSDWTDGPLEAEGRTYYGIPARRIVEGFLAPPHDSFGRQQSGTQNVSGSSLRLLMDGTDYNACLRLTLAITNNEWSAPPPRSWVYFTAGGFYFVSQWKPAQALSDYTTGYGHVMVFDHAFNLLGAYAF